MIQTPVRKRVVPVITAAVMVATMIAMSIFPAVAATQSRTYTTTADFEEGSKINVVTTGDEVKLDDTTTPFNFVWVAVSTKGTIVKIDTLTGDVLGEYLTAPDGMGTDPSRTTVDKDGNVWVTNRAEFGFVAADEIAPGLPEFDQDMGSVTHVGLVENGQCQDRNNNGVIDTSTGLGDVRGWSNTGGADVLGGVSTADDECVIHYTRVRSTGARHVSVDENNDVWVSGTGNQNFDLIDDVTGQIIRQENSVGYGGYGGLIDANGVIWSARPLLRWDTSLPLAGPNGVFDPTGTWYGYDSFIFGDSYGLCIDSQGNVWNTSLGDGLIRKYAPNGAPIGEFWQGHIYAQGCVVDANDDVWVANSFFAPPMVSHLKNDGTFVGSVATPSGPTGVAVDAAGKIWATNHDDRTASRIDPDLGPIGLDAITPVGEVDFTSVDLGGNLYNYSDMTGSTLIGAPNTGTWSVVYDSGEAGTEWGKVSWTADVFGDGALTVSVSSSEDNVTYGAPQTASNGVDLSVANGRYLKVAVNFTRATTGESPVLYDLTIQTANEAPDCSVASPSIDRIWPPNHQFVEVEILGITDADGDRISVTITSIYQDEPVDTYGDGSFSPDGYGIGTDTAYVRAERSGTKKVPGNGRVYHISFLAEDGEGGSCTGTVRVVVPHDQGEKTQVIDEGALYDSTVEAP
jgi:streptogramin lyase